MRIVAGKFRRRKLQSNPGDTTRPITDRAKELLFENLGGELQGERVADVFAGTGTIGLEALSRGASSVVFFEKDRQAHELLKENVAMLEATDETVCWKIDVLRTSFRPQGVDHLFPYDLIFFDPPYAMVADIHPPTALYKSLARLARDAVSSNNALLVLRTPKHAEFEMPPLWHAGNTYEVSNMKFFLYRKQAENIETTDIETPP